MSGRRIAVVPAYNEEPTVALVLDQLYPLVDELVVVDDGSTDGTRAEIERWLPGHDRCTLLTHDVNQGMSEAYFLALTTLRNRLACGELDADDLVFTVDADGQHDLKVLDELVQMTVDEHLDANLAQRDLSYHRAWKKSGNWVLSKWATLWAGAPLLDVESGYRIFRLGPLAHALDYYSGYQYSETVEVAVVLCQLGYKVRNDHLVPVPVSRSRTRARDAIIDLAVIPVAAARVWRRDPAPATFGTDAVASLAMAAVVGLLFVLSDVPATDGAVTLVLAAIAAFGFGALVRHTLPRPALASLGPVLAFVAAWLVPQRPDVGSSIVLAAIFGIGAALAAPGVHRPRPRVLAAAIGAFLVVQVVGTRFTLLALAVIAVTVAAVTARIGRVGMPKTYRLRTFAVGSAIVAATSGITGYFGASTVGATWFGGGIVHGPRSEPEVALTFDDGPNINATPAIMKILDDAHVKGSFFIVGKALDADPGIVRDLYAHGHLVGNHSYHHDQWRWLDPRYPELVRTQEAFARDVNVCPAWFRPPHGQKTPMMARVVHEHGMRMAMWDVSVGDWSTTDPHAVADAVLKKVRDGSIIDLHDGLDGKPWVDRSVVVRALPLILDGLRARHLRPVRLDELVGGPRVRVVREVPALTNPTDDVPGGRVAFAILVVAWIVLLAIYLSHPIVLSSDSINNHVHVWYVADDLWHHGRIPWRMPVLGHGDAYAYPYGFVNWTTAAVVWPLFGNWAVTLWTALGTVGCIVATFVAFPELRRGWWAAAVLANSALLEALLFGQQSFVWGAALLLFGVAAWRRGHRARAAVLVGIGQFTHPAVVAPMGLLLVLVYLLFTRDRWAVVRWYALSCAITLPAAALVFASPSFSDTSASSRALNFWITLGPRVLIVALPPLYTVMRRTGVRALAPAALAISIVGNVGFQLPLNVAHQWRALARRSADTRELDGYLHSPAFVTGATYRMLRDGDGKLGVYHVLQAGGRLDSELFPESMAMHNFRDLAAYESLLCDRRVDQVLHFTSYDTQRHTNERELLASLVARPGRRIRARVLRRGADWEAYGIDRSGCDGA